jgi:hypothetical protein
MKRRRGIPLTLSIVFMELGCGWHPVVRLPGQPR